MATPARPVYLHTGSPPHISTLILLPSVGALAMNVFLPSLPAMTEDFETEYSIMGLSVSLYLVGTALLQLVVGPLSDRFGRRPVVLWGLLVFLLATLGCLFAPTVEVFLVFRCLQAVMVVGIVLSRAIVRDMVPGEKAASMIGYVTMGMALTPMFGPTLGGWLEGLFSWRASFWLLFGFGLVTLLVAWRDLGETNTSKSANFLDQVRDYPELFRSRRFWGYCLTAAFSAGAYFAFLGGGPKVGTDVFDLTPEAVGLYFSAPAIGYLIGNFLSGRYSERAGLDRMIIGGCILTALGMTLSLLLLKSGVDHPLAYFGFVTFVGLGNGIVLPNTTAGLLSVRPHLAGTASGLGGSLMTGGGAALSVLAGATFGWGDGAVPLVGLMLATSVCGLLSITYTVRRAAAVGAR